MWYLDEVLENRKADNDSRLQQRRCPLREHHSGEKGSKTFTMLVNRSIFLFKCFTWSIRHNFRVLLLSCGCSFRLYWLQTLRLGIIMTHVSTTSNNGTFHHEQLKRPDLAPSIYLCLAAPLLGLSLPLSCQYTSHIDFTHSLLYLLRQEHP